MFEIMSRSNGVVVFRGHELECREWLDLCLPDYGGVGPEDFIVSESDRDTLTESEVESISEFVREWVSV